MISSQNIDILTKALPHMPDQARSYIDILLKLNQLKYSLDILNDPSLHAMDNSFTTNSNKSSYFLDIDGLFRDIRPLCSGNDAKIIDTYMNLKKSKDIISAYQAMNGGESFGIN